MTFQDGNKADGKHYWLTPEDMMAADTSQSLILTLIRALTQSLKTSMVLRLSGDPQIM
jgi:hypothetical protein